MQLEAKRPAAELHLVCHLDQPPEGDPVQRHGIAAPERVQVDAVAMVGGDHGEAGEPALGRLGLQDAWKAGSAADVEESLDHPSIPICRMGPSIQSTNVRFSRMMSALRDMSGCSGIFLPWAVISGRSSATVAA